MNVYELDALTVHAGERALVTGLTLSIAAGEAVALVGESGSGKSVSLLTPFGLNPLTAGGSARLGGAELVGMAEVERRALRAREVGFVFQQPLTALTPHMSVAAHLVEAATQAGGPKPDVAALRAMLARVGLDEDDDWLPRFPHQLSGGQRQRLCIAMALAHGPKLLVADEPVSALDAALRGEIMDLLTRLRREEGVALLLVSHDLHGLSAHVDRVVVMRSGAVVEAGAAAAMLSAPQSDYARVLLAATPREDSPILAAPLADGAPVLLSAEGVTVRFPRKGWRTPDLVAVDDATLTLRAGETLALVGGSGSGKSTLGRALAGLGPMQSGGVSWQGEPLPPRPKRTAAHRALIQPVFQDPFASLNPKWPVARSIAEPMVHLRPEWSRTNRDTKVAALLDEVGLSADIADRLPRQVSGGQAQRVALARALSVDPDMLLLDEATSALDPLIAAQIAALLVRLQQSRGLAMLMITHDMMLARQMAHRIAVMAAGRIVEMGAAEAVFANPQSEAVRRLLGATRGSI